MSISVTDTLASLLGAALVETGSWYGGRLFLVVFGSR